MLIGYARTSTLEQEAGFEAQLRELTAQGCEKLFREQVSSVAPRQQLETALEFAREGDTLVVTKLDRLARSVVHLGKIIETLEAKGVALRILDLGVDTSTPTGKLMLNVLGGVAQFEREMMLERQREGIAKAKAEGAYKGRKPTARAKAEEIRALAAQGLSMGAIAAQLGIGKGSVHRVLSAGKAAPVVEAELAAAPPIVPAPKRRVPVGEIQASRRGPKPRVRAAS
ncbi:DNA invertase Pin-like site-specific DNA recombinase [Methylorubrum extorquens]|nr:DNA invertase Pin-like site-specific DNA recombinase [Methylorubrum extorquens]